MSDQFATLAYASSESMTSSSEAALEFTRTLQNYPLARRDALRLKQQPEESVESSDLMVSRAVDELKNASIPEIGVYGPTLPGYLLFFLS